MCVCVGVLCVLLILLSLCLFTPVSLYSPYFSQKHLDFPLLRQKERQREWVREELVMCFVSCTHRYYTFSSIIYIFVYKEHLSHSLLLQWCLRAKKCQAIFVIEKWLKTVCSAHKQTNKSKAFLTNERVCKLVYVHVCALCTLFSIYYICTM